jgi:mannan endo-1,4-beta-mannosidase
MIVDWQRTRYGLRDAWCFALLLAFVSVLAIVSTPNDPSATSFIKTFGRPFFVTGVNNQYLPYGSHDEITRALDEAVALGACAMWLDMVTPWLGRRRHAIPAWPQKPLTSCHD